MKPRGDDAVLPDVGFGFSNASALATRSVPIAAAGIDPVFGSGPLATVIQDLASIVIYFGFATLIL